jgi:hypothetical protein
MLDDSGMHAAARSLAADMTRAEAETPAVNEVEALATRNAIARGIPATIETIPV